MRRVIYTWGMSRMNESCKTQLSLVTYEFIWIRRLTSEWGKPNMYGSCQTCQTWTGHATDVWSCIFDWGIHPLLAVCYEGVVFITNTRQIIYLYHGSIPFHTWYNSLQHLRLNFAANLTIRKVAATFCWASRSSSKAARRWIKARSINSLSGKNNHTIGRPKVNN